MSNLDDLRGEVKAGRIAAVIGAGVSMRVSDNNANASWVGLLKAGVARCRELDPSLGKDWAQRKLEDLGSQHLPDLLAVASVVQCVLQEHPGEYAAWLRSTVGALKAVFPEVPLALRAITPVLATTNYDNLLEEVLGVASATWRDPIKMMGILRGDDVAIAHLHGHYSDPASVVLGIDDYSRILVNSGSQARQQFLAMGKSLLLVGFGEGLQDPNFRPLLRWIGEVYGDTPYFHYQLVLDNETKFARQIDPSTSHIRVISYGKSYNELGVF